MRSKAEKPRSDIYETITAKLLAAIEASPGDPIMPWQRGGTQPVLPTNAVTGQTYRGVNILSLWVTALERGYDSGEWATLRQWNEKGARVRKGEKASPIVFYKEIAVAAEADGDAGEGETERRRFARGYWVFAAEQVDGYQPATALPSNPIAPVAAAEAYFAAAGAKIVVGGTQACYRRSTDTVHMPDEARFIASDGRTRTESWYAVLGHEATHWSGARSRTTPRPSRRRWPRTSSACRWTTWSSTRRSRPYAGRACRRPTSPRTSASPSRSSNAVSPSPT
jgi:antirestriction protein ArdC